MQTIQQYDLLEPIGRGGMGVVYRALDTETGQYVALKTVLEVHRQNVVSLRREIQKLLDVQHPYVIKILGQGVHQGLPWYAMELLEDGQRLSVLRRDIRHALSGLSALDQSAPLQTLDESLLSRTMDQAICLLETMDLSTSPITAHLPRPQWQEIPEPPVNERLEQVLHLISRLCVALSHLHSHGLVHRDLKPENIFVRSNGEPVLMDFGLASRFVDRKGRDVLEIIPSCHGTPTYMAPEQICGHEVDARADFYALGCILYELVTGHFPFPGASMEVVFYQHIYVQPRAPRELVQELDPRLEALILRLLSKQRRDRFGYADDVWGQLQRLDVEPLPEGIELASMSYLYRSPLVGREALRQRLLARLQRVSAQGEGGAAVLMGESGVGKTFLAKAVAAMARVNMTVVVGESEAEEVGRSLPLYALRPLLQAVADHCQASPKDARSLLGRYGSVLAPYEPSLAQLPLVAQSPPPATLPPRAARHRLMRALTHLLDAYSRCHPLLLVLDDLQWVDELTLDFLGSLPPDFCQRRSLFVLATCRREGLGDELGALMERQSVDIIDVERLDRASVAEMASEMLALESAPEGLVEVLHQRSEGNPFFVAEYLRLAVSEGLLVRHDGRWRPARDQNFGSMPLPTSLRELFGRRLERLDRDAMELAQMAAVLGREARLDVLERMGSSQDLASDPALGQLIQSYIVELDGRGALRFVHNHLRTWLYQSLEEGQRVALHRRAGIALESLYTDPAQRDAHSDVLLTHFQRCGDQARSLHYLVQSGRRALSASAHAAALVHLEAAVALWPRLRSGQDLELARLYRQLGDCYLGLHRVDRARERLEHAAQLLGWPIPTGRGHIAALISAELSRQMGLRVLRRRFKVPRFQPRYQEGALVYSSYQEAARSGADSTVILLATLRSLNLAEVGGTVPLLGRSYALAWVIVSAIGLERPAQTYRRLARRALEYTQDLDDHAWYLQMSSIYHFGRGLLARSHKEASQAVELGARCGSHVRQEESSMVLMMVDQLQGRVHSVLQSSQQVFSLAQRGSERYQLWSQVFAARALLRLGELREARERLEGARRWYQEVEPSDKLSFDALYALLEVMEGRHREALVHLEAAHGRMANFSPGMVEGVLPFSNAAEAASLLPRGELPQRVLEVVSTWMTRSARTLPVLVPEARYLEALLALGGQRSQQGLALLERSRQEAMRLHLDWVEARALALQAQLERAQAPRERALALLQPYGLSLRSVPSPGDSL